MTTIIHLKIEIICWAAAIDDRDDSRPLNPSSLILMHNRQVESR